MKLFIHSQASTVQPLKFRNEWIISSHSLLGMWLFIHDRIKVTTVPLKGSWVRYLATSPFFNFQLPFGCSVAASIRVGQFLGAGKPWHARAAGWTSLSVMSKWQNSYVTAASWRSKSPVDRFVPANNKEKNQSPTFRALCERNPPVVVKFPLKAVIDTELERFL